MPAPKLLLVDPRWGQAPERRDQFVAALTQLGYCPVLRQLATGDIVWSSRMGRVGVEMKGMEDLLTSHQEGRLDDELYRLQREFAVAVLLLTEPLGYDVDVPPIGGFSWHAVDNLLVGRQLKGIIVARCNEVGPAQRIDKLYRYLERPQQRVIRPRERHFPAMGRMSARAETIYRLLQAVRGIRNKAEIAERMAGSHSLADVTAMTAKSWHEAGFTKLMAGRLAKFCREV